MVDYQLKTSVTNEDGQYSRLNYTVKVQVCNKYFVQKCSFFKENIIKIRPICGKARPYSYLHHCGIRLH